jgi:hypothetical protein
MADDQYLEREPRDYTKWVWTGIVFLVAAMAGAVWLSGQRTPDRSTVTARHILIACDHNDPADRQRAMTLAAELRERISQGESFAQLARQFSGDDSSAARGGLLRPFTRRDQLEANFQTYVWSAPIGELSGLIRTSYGFHIVQVEDRYLSEGDRYAEELERRAKEALTGQPVEPSTPTLPAPNTSALPSAAVYE